MAHGPSATTLVPADWDPYITRPANYFDELFVRLRPECVAIIEQYEDSRSALIPLAHLFQEHEGYLSQNAIVAIAYLLGLVPAVVESTVSFYTLFFRKPVGKYMLQVCRNLSCLINGAEEIMAHFRERLGLGHLETTPDGLISYEEAECLAACDQAPCMQVNLEFVHKLTTADVDALLAAIREGSCAVAPLVQTAPPERTWKIAQDTGRKSAGGRDVTNPNNAGGIGDRTGVIMLDRLIADPGFGQRSRERVLHEKHLAPGTGDGTH
jgi:NADH-quinone oxidoreductase subunit E